MLALAITKPEMIKIDYNEWSRGSKWYLLTASEFVKRNPQIKQLTASVVLTFILEDHAESLCNCIDKFFEFKHRNLKAAITGKSEPGPFYSDYLSLAIRSSLHADGSTLSLSKFTTCLVEQCGGKIVKRIVI